MLKYLLGFILCGFGIWVTILCDKSHTKRKIRRITTPKSEVERIEREEQTERIMKRTLNSLCRKIETVEKGVLTAVYLDELFYIEIGAGCVRIWDPGWGVLKRDDPKLPIVREAVEAVNLSDGPKIVLSVPDENGMVSLMSCMDIEFHIYTREKTGCMYKALNSFFDKKDQFMRIYTKLGRTTHVGEISELDDKEDL